VAKQKLSILIVEDNNMFLEIASEMLTEHKVIAVTSAEEGIMAYKQNKPDITLLDIALPDGNGHDVLKEIKQINPEAYVVMMTASRLKDDVLKSMDAGAEGYIMKPFSDGMVNECINEFYAYREKSGK
jgi:two-component system chemotaxis response regulator CheY